MCFPVLGARAYICVSILAILPMKAQFCSQSWQRPRNATFVLHRPSTTLPSLLSTLSYVQHQDHHVKQQRALPDINQVQRILETLEQKGYNLMLIVFLCALRLIDLIVWRAMQSMMFFIWTNCKSFNPDNRKVDEDQRLKGFQKDFVTVSPSVPLNKVMHEIVWYTVLWYI